MQDWKDIEKREGIASAALTSDMPAVKHRNRLVALIAVIFVAAALLFAMPSLAYASSEADASPQGEQAQEILLSSQRSSMSVNVTPDEPDIAPPPYKATDAYATTSDKNSEVVVVSGDGASNRVSYTEDGKDSDSDASDNAIDNAGSSDTGSDANSDDTSNPDIDKPSTGDSTGASSIVNDELATGNNSQSAQPTVDSTTDDVKATDRDGQSAVQTAGATSDSRGEVKDLDSDSASGASTIAPTSGAGDTITIHLYDGFLSTDGALTADTPIAANTQYGYQDDPIWSSDGTFITLAGAEYKAHLYASGTNVLCTEQNLFLGVQRVGYSLNTWIMTYYNGTTKKYVRQKGTAASGLDGFKTVFKNAQASDIHIYAVWNTTSQITVTYKDKDNVDYPSPYTGGGRYYTTVLPVPTTSQSGYSSYEFIPSIGSTKGTEPLAEGSTVSDMLNSIYHFRGSNRNMSSYPTLFSAFVLTEQEIVEAVSFNVTYNNGGGTGTAVTKSYTTKSACATADGTAAGADPVTFTRTGYTFKGWATTNGATTVQINPKGALSPTLACANGVTYTLYAVWEPIKYSITYNGNSPSTGTPANVPNKEENLVHGSNVTLSNTKPTLTGWTFAGWATTASGSVAYVAGDTYNNIQGNVTLYAKWTAWPTVSYDGNGHTGGTVPGGTSVEPGNDYNIADGVPTKTGYVFAGWTTSKNVTTGTKYSYNGTAPTGVTGSFNGIYSNMPSSNVTFYALWNPTITYNANRPATTIDATTNQVTGMPTPNPVTIAYNTNATIAAAPALIGWTFDGWYTASNGTGTKYTAGQAVNNLTTSLTLYAKWVEKTGYSVVFYDQQDAASDGAAYNTQSNLTWTQAISLPSGTPTKTGYTFGGWYTTKNGASATGTKITSVTKFNMLWEVMKSAGVADGNTTQLKVYAMWIEKDKVSLTLNPNGGTYNGTTAVYTISNILNGGTASIPAANVISNPTREGYNFKGWTESSAGTGTVYQAGNTPFATMSESKTLYAKWEACIVTFTFDANATASEITAVKGSNPYTMTAAYGTNLAVPKGTDVYTRNAYNFAKWTYTNSANNSVDIAAAGASVAVSNFKIVWEPDTVNGGLKGKATIVANWTPYTYTVAWLPNYGSNTAYKSDANMEPTSTLTQPQNPTRGGYTFKGWKTSADGTGNTVATGNSVASTWTLTTVSSGATLNAYAIWEENKVMIRVYGDGSKAGIQYADGSSFPLDNTIYVGAATGAIYASASATTPTSKNISTGVKPLFTDANYEFSSAHGSKWTKGSATGATVGTAETLAATALQTNNLYVAGDYYLTVSPKWYAYTIEYYQQNTTGSGYTKATSPAGSGTAPYGYALVLGTTAGTNDSTKTVTVVRSDITGFTYNAAAPGSVTNLTAISSTTGNNVLKLYFDRNTWNIQVSYSGDVPPSMSYTPATDTKRYGETVTLTAPTAPTGYTWGGWTLKSGSGVTANQVRTGSFAMPNSALVIEGVWTKNKYNVLFQNDATNGNMSGTSSYQLNYLDSLTATPTITPKVPEDYYFMGWELFEDCTSSSTTSVTGGTSKGIMSVDAILGQGAYAGNPWQVTSHSRFLARFGKTVAVSYTNGGADAFVTVNGSMVGGTVTKKGTFYTQLSLDWAVPGYGGATDPANDRNALNPHAAPGYKFVGWEWNDAVAGNVTMRALGHYNAAGQFVLTSGDAMPTIINQSLTFKAIWEKTTQQIHFEEDSANITGLKVSPKPADIAAQIDDVVNLPKAPAMSAATNPTGYTFLGWTTALPGTYAQGTSPLYTDNLKMTAGDRSTSVYNMNDAVRNDGGYGITLYPVFSENTVTILYKVATGCDSMGTVSLATEGNTFKMVTGTPSGSTPTANTGYKFIGWFKNANHTTPVDASWVNSSTKKITPQKNGGVFEGATYYAYFEPEQYVITFQVGDQGTWTDGSASSSNKTATLTFNTNYGTNVPTYSGTGAAMKANTGYGFKEWAEINPTTGAVVRTLSDSALRAERITGAKTFKAVWEPRSGYTIVYNTNGGTPSFSSQQVTWTAVLDNVMTTAAKTGPTKLGYTFGGWYTKADFSDPGLTSTLTFEQAIAQAGITVDGDGTATLTLFAKWNERSFTLKYRPSWPGSTTTTFADKTVTWTQANLLPAGYATLSETGYDFKNWNTASNATGLAVTNATTVEDIYKRVYGTNDNTKTELTIYGCWGQRTFTVQFKSETGTVVKSYNNVNFNSTVDYYNYAPSDGSKTLLGWKYTPAGGTETTWASSNAGTPLSVSVFDGTPSPADGSIFVLTAVMQNNCTFNINYYTVNVDNAGNPIMSQAAKLKTESGYAPVGVGINIKDGSFNGTDYVTRFEMQNGAGRRTDLKGYVLQTIPGQTKISADASEVTSGGTVTFNVYFVEKIFTITYDRGVDAQGHACPTSVVMPDDKNASWNSSNILPDTTPVWEGYKAPKWQYKNATGTWVNLPANAKVKDITTTDDNTNPITLRALWESDQVRLTFNSQTGGVVRSSDGSIVVPSGNSKFKDIDAVTGPAPTVTATAGNGYIFLGWFKDGVEVSTNPTYTVTAVDGLFSSATYEARFRALDSINYTIKHFFEDAVTGAFVERTELAETRSGQENATIDKTNDMVKSIKGFTHQTGILGEKLHIASLGDDDNELKLYYRVNEHDVWVAASATGADCPTSVTINYPTTGITQSHTQQKFGVALVLPTVTVPDGWAFKWSVKYRESDSTSDTTRELEPGANFSMVDADVNIVGLWKRNAHTVNFVAGPDAHGTVAAIAPATLPFRVDHGKNLTDASATGNYSNIKVTAQDKWALAGWSYVDENGVTRDTDNPNSVIINVDTVFTAKWAQTFSVIYQPGAHGGVNGSDNFTQLVTVAKDIALAENKNVSTVPFVLNGNNYDSNAPAAPGYNFIGWSWTRGGTKYYQVMNAPSASFNLSAYGVAGTRNWVIDENVTFTAIWEAAPQTLKYVWGPYTPAPTWTATGAAAGTTGDTFTVTPSPRTDDTVTLLDSNSIAREGWTLSGWRQWVDANKDGVVQASEFIGGVISAGGTFTMPASEVVFVSMWEFDSLKVNYVIETGSEGRGTLDSDHDNITNNGIGQLKGSTATANTGYKFDGWYTDAACTNKVDASWLSNATDPSDPTAILSSKVQPKRPSGGWVAMTLYAKFVPGKAEYKIEYYLQETDGTYTLANITPNKFADIDTDQTADVTDPSNPAYAHRLNTNTNAYAGYVFNDNAYGQILTAVVKADGTTTLKLYYDLRWFDIEYDLGTNGAAVGTWASNEGPNRAIGGGMVVIPEARLTGMSLSGWTIVYTDADGNEQRMERGSNFQMPFFNVKAIAKWDKNIDFKVVVYEGAWNGSTLTTTNKVIASNWPSSFASGDGVATVTVNGTTGEVVISAPNTQGSTLFPLNKTLPRVPGFEYNAASAALSILNSTDAPIENGYKVLKIYLAPKNNYKVNYVVILDGKELDLGSKNNVAWTDDNLGMATLPANLAGYEYDGYGWQYKESGDYYDVDAAMTYGYIVNEIYGMPRDTINQITLYAKIKPLSYKVIFVDDTNGTDESAQTILEKGDYNWPSNVELVDPATFTPAYNKTGYKWMGWEIRKADGSKVALGASIDYKTLATQLGLNATTALENGVTVYAKWAEWLPVTIEFYTKDSNGETKFHEINYTAAEHMLYTGSTYRVPDAIVADKRPVGYVLDASSILSVLGDPSRDNVIKVYFKETNGYILILKTNYGANADAQRITGLGWTSKPDSRATAAPTRIGWRLLDKPQRWNTKADGTGHDFDADATYAQIAEWIYGNALDDAAILKSGLTLYAQWKIADDFEVIYDLNNDKETNNKIQTVVPDFRNPMDVEELKKAPVAWTDNGFDQSNDTELDAAPFGYIFAGWNTKADGTGLQITNDMTYADISNYLNPNAEAKSITLYAQWTELEVEIKYTVDNEEAGSIDRFLDKIKAVSGEHDPIGSSSGTKLQSVAKANPGWHFVRWEVVVDGRARAISNYANELAYQGSDGSTIVVNPDTESGRLYGAEYRAIFERNPEAQVEYDVNGGEGVISPFAIPHGSYFTLSDGSGFKRGHYTIKGWNTKPDGTGTHYSLGQGDLVMPEAGMKLYAEWDLNSYNVTANDGEKGGTITPGSTSIKYGEKIPASFISGLSPKPNPGWSLTGWKYTMTNAETGEVTEGFTTDPTTITVDGPISLTPVFDGADPIVDGPPRTGDDVSYEFELMLAAMWTALAAAMAMLILLVVARRRRNQETVNEQLAAEAAGVYGTHAISWGDERATKLLRSCGLGAHSKRSDGASVARLEREIQETSEEFADCASREDFVMRAIANGMGAHAKVSSASASDNELRMSSCGAHSVAAAGPGQHSIPVLSNEAAAGTVERLGASQGEHSVSKAGERVSERLVAFYGEHSVRRVDDGVYENFAAIKAPVRPEAPSMRQRVASGVRALRPRVSSAGQHEVAVANAARAAVQSAMQPAVAPAASVATASVASAPAVIASTSSSALHERKLDKNFLRARQTAAIFVALCERASLAPLPPVSLTSSERRAMLRGTRRLVTSSSGQLVASATYCAAADAPDFAHIALSPATSDASAVAPPRFSSRLARVAFGVPTMALALCLGFFGVGAHLSPIAAYADESPGQGVVSAAKGEYYAQNPSSEGTTVPSDGRTVPSGGSGADKASDAVNAVPSGISSSADGDTNTIDDATKALGGSESDSKALEGTQEGTDALDEAADGSEGSLENADAALNDSADAENSGSASENSADSSKNDSPRHENNGDNPFDSTHSDNPAAPVDAEAPGNSPADLPSEDGSYTPPFSGDDSSNASIVTPKDSNAPPSARVDSPPPPDDGTYYIRWEQYQTYWLGHTDEKLEVSVKPSSTYGFDWVLSRVSGTAYDNVYSLRAGNFYLSRNSEYPTDHDVSLSSVLDQNSYWRIVAYINVKGQTVYYLFDMDEKNAITFNLDNDWLVDGIICDSYNQDMIDLGSAYRFYFDKAEPQDWDIKYNGNGATEGNTPKTTVTVTEGGTVSACDYTRFGFNFAGWNTAADGSGTWYAVGQHVAGGTILASGYSLTLYAQWDEIFADITFTGTAGGQVQLGTDGEPEGNIIQTVSSATGILKDTTDQALQGVTAVAAPGFHFGYWTIVGGIGELSDLYKYSETLTADQIRILSKVKNDETGWTLYSNLTLIAEFLPNTYTIHFDANGGFGSMEPKTVTFGEINPVTEMNGLSRVSYRFDGWNTKLDGTGTPVGNAATLEDLINAGVLRNADGSLTTLYAMWAEDPNAGGNFNPDVSGGDQAINDGNGGWTPSGNVGNGGNASSIGAYTSRTSGSATYTPSGTVPVAEAATLNDVTINQGNSIKTISPRNSGPFEAIGQFFSTSTGKVVGVICGIGLAIAAIAGIAAAVMHFAGAGAAGSAAAGSAQGSKGSRSRRNPKKK